MSRPNVLCVMTGDTSNRYQLEFLVLGRGEHGDRREEPVDLAKNI